MLNVTGLRIEFRGYPVTQLSQGAYELIVKAGTRPIEAHLLAMLATARETAEADEPPGWYFEAELCGKAACIERFGGIRDLSRDTHEGGQWSVFLPGER
jgi:hypothetical protein